MKIKFLLLNRANVLLLFSGVWRKEIDSTCQATNPPANAGDIRDSGSIPGLGGYPGVGNGNLLQYSCLENSMDRGAWQAIVHGVAKSWSKLRN